MSWPEDEMALVDLGDKRKKGSAQQEKARIIKL
jgi:hypothetical protein